MRTKPKQDVFDRLRKRRCEQQTSRKWTRSVPAETTPQSRCTFVSRNSVTHDESPSRFWEVEGYKGRPFTGVLNGVTD